MNDIVQRLRDGSMEGSLMHEAADRIELLELALRKTIAESEFIIADVRAALAEGQDK